MISLSKQIKEWVENNDWYSGGVLTNELKFIQRYGPQIQKVTLELDYHGQNVIARQIQERMNCLLERCRKIDEACRSGCRTQEQFLELDFIRSRAIGLANELAQLLAMIETMQSRPAADTDDWVTFAEAAALLVVAKSTISKWVDKGRFTDNGQSGRSRKLLKSSVLMVKQQIEDEEVKKDVKELRADGKRL